MTDTTDGVFTIADTSGARILQGLSRAILKGAFYRFVSIGQSEADRAAGGVHLPRTSATSFNPLPFHT